MPRRSPKLRVAVGCDANFEFLITRQILGGLGITVLVFMFVLVLGNLLKEVLGLLASGQATLGLVAQALGLLIPFVLVW